MVRSVSKDQTRKVVHAAPARVAKVACDCTHASAGPHPCRCADSADPFWRDQGLPPALAAVFNDIPVI